MLDAVATEGPPSRRGFALSILISGSLVISFAGVLVRTIEAADPWQVNFYRALGQMGFVLVVLTIQYRGELVGKIIRIGWPGVLAGLSLSLASMTYMESITNTTVANTMFAVSVIPLATALLARLFLKEALRRETMIAICIATAGVAIMMGDGLGTGSLYGNVMGLLCALTYSAFAIFVRKHRDLDMLPTLLVSTVIVAGVCALVKQGELSVTTHDLSISIFWGVVLVGFANWTFIIASRHLEAAEVTFFMLLEFAAGPLWVWLIIGETATLWTLVGGALVIGSVAARATIQLHQTHRARRRPMPIGSP